MKSLSRWGRMIIVVMAGLHVQAERAGSQVPMPRTIIYAGPLYPKRYASDNGIPGTGNYAYDHYNWPSFRQALKEYGWFGRRIKSPDQVGFWNSILPPVQMAPAPVPFEILPEPRKQ